MMDFRQRLEQSRSKPANSEAEQPEELLSHTYFAADRAGSPLCLDLRLRNGSRKAIPYSYLSEMSYDAEKGIEILTSTKRITITGRNLSTLYDYLITYRLRFVQANIGNDTQEDGPFVDEIRVEEIG